MGARHIIYDLKFSGRPSLASFAKCGFFVIILINKKNIMKYPKRALGVSSRNSSHDVYKILIVTH